VCHKRSETALPGWQQSEQLEHLGLLVQQSLQRRWLGQLMQRQPGQPVWLGQRSASELRLELPIPGQMNQRLGQLMCRQPGQPVRLGRRSASEPRLEPWWPEQPRLQRLMLPVELALRLWSQQRCPLEPASKLKQAQAQ